MRRKLRAPTVMLALVVAACFAWITQRRVVAPGFPCPEHLRCSNIIVPKDYFDPAAGTASIAVAIFPATESPRWGSLFVNPGGPGGSGVRMAIGAAKEISVLSGGHYDIVGFDPRGIGLSRPLVSCFPLPSDFQAFLSGTIIENGFSQPPDLKKGFGEFVAQFRSWLALWETQFRLCGNVLGDELKYMGTATVVRDMDYMAQLLDGENAPIHFYGGSYGTVVGAWLVGMLPHRVGRTAIDGCVNPKVWYNAPLYDWFSDFSQDVEVVFDVLLGECSKAGPELCALAEHQGEAPEKIGQRIDAFLDELYYHPLPVPAGPKPGIVTAGGARGILYFATNSPRSWPKFAEAVAQAMKGDGRSLHALILSPIWTTWAGDTSRSAVSCLDSLSYANVKPEDLPSAEVWANASLRVLQETSPRFGVSGFWIERDGPCQYWPATGRGPERFVGPWTDDLANPMLIVSAKHDPVTPLASARYINKLMPKSSRLLIQDSIGHTSTTMGSLCTAKAFLSYYLNGTLPENEAHCPGSDIPIFPSPRNATVESAISEADKALLHASHAIGEALLGPRSNLYV